MTREEISLYNEEALICDGFDEAIIGMAERINLGPVVAYDVDKIIDILIPQMELTDDELMDIPEHFEYNIKNSWMGEFTPVFIYKD
jgi:hypothetical protein